MLFPYCVSRSRQPVLKEYAVKYGVNKKMEFVTRQKFIPWLENHI
jgi:hypothetical protein